MRTRLHQYIGGTIRGLGGIPFAINGTEDHVRALAKLRQDKALSDVLRDLKANASGWMRNVFPEQKDFAWQNGYAHSWSVHHRWIPDAPMWGPDYQSADAGDKFSARQCGQ